ncbi:hypothetical protein TcBrA4_0050460 [Trypanosoma cruzi]|nr:hypothetical protein TcBrA4_0050460 [Trypanosoma cruzi]
MTYWRSGGEEKSFHEDPQSTKATGAVMMASTAADAETSFASPSAAVCVEPHKGAVCERVVNDGSVEVFRRRLVARCAAIPPAVRHAHMGTAAAPRRAAGGIDTASRVDAAGDILCDAFMRPRWRFFPTTSSPQLPLSPSH